MSDVLAGLGYDELHENVQSTAAALLAIELDKLELDAYGDPEIRFSSEVLGIPPESVPPTTAELTTLRRNLPGERRSHAFFYLLAHTYAGPAKHAELYESMTTKTVQLSLRLAEMGEQYRDDIYVACRRVWLASTRQPWLFDHLESFKRPFSTIHENILSAASSDDAKANDAVDSLEEWASVIQRMLDEKAKRRRMRPGDTVSLAPETIRLDDIADDGATIDIVSPREENTFPADNREIQHDRSPQKQLARVQPKSSSKDRSDGMVALRGLEIVSSLHRRYASSPCLYNRLTDYEIEKAISRCLEQAQRSVAYLYLLLSMIYGRSVERLIGIQKIALRNISEPGDYWVVGRETVALAYQMDLPGHEGFDLSGSDKGNHIVLPLPPRIGQLVRKLLTRRAGTVPPVDVRGAVIDLRKTVSPRITALNLQQSLAQSMTSAGIDEAIVGWIAGTAPEHCAALYYSSFERSQVLSVFYDHLESRLPDGTVKRWPIPDGTIGSNLRVPEELVTDLLQAQATRIESARKGADIDRIEHHNELVIYTSQVLALASGTRAVSEPLGKLSGFNIDAGTLRLADKNNRRDGAYRTVVLGELALAQAREYNRNLDLLAEWYSEARTDVAEFARGALDGTASWLFLIGNRRVEPLRPKLIQRILEYRWRAPLNWPRHFLRSWFFSRGYDRGTVRSFMGHADTGAAPQSRFDGSSLFELRALATDLDDLLCSLKIPVVSSWS